MSQNGAYGQVADASRRGRLDGVATDRRRRHNAVKRFLVGRALACLGGPDAARTAHILDLGCGRGGDLAKWLVGHPGRAYVGIDASAGAILEARRRAAEMGVADRCEFLVGDMVEVVGRHAAAWRTQGRTFQVVACMFALHYCCLGDGDKVEHPEARVVDRLLARVPVGRRPGPGPARSPGAAVAHGRAGDDGPEGAGAGAGAEAQAVLVVALPDHDTILGSPHVVRAAGVPHGGQRYVYHWPPLVCHSLEQRLRVDRLVASLKKCQDLNGRWSLVLDSRFDALGVVGDVGVHRDDRYYRGCVIKFT